MITHKVLHTGFLHKKGFRTTDTRLVSFKGRTFKFSYEAYNSGENFDCDLFDGQKFNRIFCHQDLGIPKENSAYLLLDEKEIKSHIEKLFKAGIQFITNVLTNS